MKGHALEKRFKQKDAYDIYYCIRGRTLRIGGDCRARIDACNYLRIEPLEPEVARHQPLRETRS
jgi:hypothetical protein